MSRRVTRSLAAGVDKKINCIEEDERSHDDDDEDWSEGNGAKKPEEDERSHNDDDEDWSEGNGAKKSRAKSHKNDSCVRSQCDRTRMQSIERDVAPAIYDDEAARFMYTNLKKHPVNDIYALISKSARSKHINEKKYEQLEILNAELHDFINNVLGKYEFCYDSKNKQFMRCTCISQIRGREVEIKNMVSGLAQLPKNELNVVFKYAIKMKGRIEQLPGNCGKGFTLELSRSNSLNVCSNTYRNMFGLKNNRWVKLKKDAEENALGIKLHGNTGNTHKTNYSSWKECEERFKFYLTEIANQYGTPTSMSFIAILCGGENLNDKSDHVYLPMTMSKRKIYEYFVFVAGYKIKSDRKGNYGRLCDYPIRDNHDLLWPVGSTCLPVCSWTSFRKGWRTHFPKLYIRKKYTDVCLVCFYYRNKFRYKQYKDDKKNNRNIERYMEWYEESSSMSSISSHSSESNVLSGPDVEVNDSDGNESDDDGISDNVVETEHMLEKAGRHIQMAKSQRGLSDEVSKVC